MMNSGALADAAERERALDPERSFIVGAPAGSGKTTLLTQRFLRLLSRVAQPESIVAITFTRKAAEEMRGRVLAALRAVRDGTGELDPVTARWAGAALAMSDANDWRLLENPRRLRMQTIDALAAAVARRGPLSSGFAGDVAVTEDARALYDQAARATIAELGGAAAWTDAVRTLLAHFDNNWERLERMLAEMLARRDQWLRFVVQRPQREAFEQALTRTIIAELNAACSALPPAHAAEMAELAAFGARHLALRNPDDPRTRLDGLSALPGIDVAELPRWRALTRVFLTASGTWRQRINVSDGFGKEAREEKARMLAVIEALSETPGALDAMRRIGELPDPAYTDPDWDCLDALFNVLKLAAAQLQIEFDRRGAVDFAYVSQAALDALGGLQAPSELQLALDYQVQHLLVDEFQDTSIAQFELVERLIEGWTAGDGRSVFLVGDPMQSIYRFREADVSLFVDTAAAGRLSSVALEYLQLTTNFRAQAGLIDWLNGTVATLNASPDAPYATLPAIVAARPPVAGDAVEVHAVVDDDARAETATVVEIVAASLTADRRARIGILVRSRTHLGLLGEQLHEAGIAVAASDIDRLAAQPIVLDLVALTRALLHPADQTAWLAVLRAPWCGLGLRELCDLFESARDCTVLERLREIAADARADNDTRARVLALLEILERFVPLGGRLAAAELVEAAWVALDGPACYESNDLRHAARYLDLLSATADRSGTPSPQQLDALLAGEFAAPPSQSDARVEIMTIHAAKGLEFDVVIVPGLGRKPRGETRRLLEWRAHYTDAGAELLFAPIEPAGAANAPINAFLRAADKRETEQESYRLLYVAMTRARERLHLVGAVKRADDDGIATPAGGSFLRMLWPAVSERVRIVDAQAGAAAAAGRGEQRLRRFVEPVAIATMSGTAPSDRVEDPAVSERLELEFSWASPIAKHIGTVTHAALQRISNDGLAAWPVTRVAELAPAIEQRLRVAGVEQGEIASARARILRALRQALESPRGRWILGDEHGESHSEYALSALVQGQPVNIVIDRTFIDTHGRRWIIDFKTGAHAGGSVAAFIDSEVERYRPQLERYASLLRLRESRETRLGLYFPLLEQWREWAFEETADARR